MYCQARGIGVPDPTTYAFCQALSMFRIAAILAGVGARAQLGNASSKQAAEVRQAATEVGGWALGGWVCGAGCVGRGRGAEGDGSVGLRKGGLAGGNMSLRHIRCELQPATALLCAIFRGRASNVQRLVFPVHPSTLCVGRYRLIARCDSVAPQSVALR